MSQLNVDTIKDRTGADQPDIVGTAKAWVNFNGTGTVAILEQFNVDSITDNGTGAFTVNLTTALSGTTGALAGLGRNTQGALNGQIATTSTIDISVRRLDTNALVDLESNSVTVFEN